MRMTTGLFTALLALALGIVVASPVQARATEHQPSPADVAAFRNFTLTESLFDKYMAVGADIAEHPCRLGLTGMLTGKYEGMTLDQMAADWRSSPGVAEMLDSHDISAKKMILATVTLMGAALQELTAKYPQAQSSGNTKISDANMAFYRAHKAEIREQAQQRGRNMSGKNSLRSCLNNAKS